MDFEIQKQKPKPKDIMFYVYKYKKNRELVTLSEDSTLGDIYEIAKTRMFTKWQYYRRESKKPMDEIMEDIQSQIIHDIFVADSEYKEILSVPNDKTKTIREFINENEKFFIKSASYFTPFRIENAQMQRYLSLIYAHIVGALNEKRCKTIYKLFAVDEFAVRQMIAEQNNTKPVTIMSRYVKCITI
jgi:hypothetical protein